MLKDLLKKSLRIAVAFVLWVFILSFRWQGRTLFDRSHEVLVDNTLVSFLEQQLYDPGEKVLLTTVETYQKLWTKTEQKEEAK